jgi:hypothetical protein
MIRRGILFFGDQPLRTQNPRQLGVCQPPGTSGGCQAKGTAAVAPILAGEYPVRKRYVNLADWTRVEGEVFNFEILGVIKSGPVSKILRRLTCPSCLTLEDAADWDEYVPARTSMRRTGTGADELLEQIDHFRLAGNLSDRLFVIFVHCRAPSPMGRPSTSGEKVLALRCKN